MRINLVKLLIIFGCFLHTVSVHSASTRALYVDSVKGNDLNDGTSPEKAWMSLLHAAKEIKAGDHVFVAPGVYRGGIQIQAKGNPDAPIIIEANAIEGSTIITLADADIRNSKKLWSLENSKSGLYSISYNGGPPSRVLYSGIDLYPYESKEALNSFSTSIGKPGPKHGHYYDASENKLYIRLHASGKYGSVNPNDHLMAVAPPPGDRFDRTLVSKTYHYGIGIIGAGNAHIIIDGFTFETPGVAGVYTEANYVKIRNSWFQGCRTGVAGNYKDRTTTDPEGMDYYSLRFDPTVRDLSASHITIEYCDFHQEPCFEDAIELMNDFKGTNGKMNDREYSTFWHRKSVGNGLPNGDYKYEIGFAARIGSDWIIRRNNIHDIFDGLSCHAVSASRGLRVEYNIFSRMLDNAVETEDHSSNMHIYRNVIVDSFMPISWQPIRGTPWPCSIFLTENIIYNSPENQNLWRNIGFEGRGLLKIGVKAITWQRVAHMVGTLYAPVTVPEYGLILANNTIICPGANLIETQGGRDMPVHNVNIINNIIDTDYLLSLDPSRDLKSGHFNFENNSVYFSRATGNGAAQIAAGSKGTITSLPNAQNLDLNFKPADDSNLINTAMIVPNLCNVYSNIGAIQPDSNWYPPKVGPRVKD